MVFNVKTFPRVASSIFFMSSHGYGRRNKPVPNHIKKRQDLYKRVIFVVAEGIAVTSGISRNLGLVLLKKHDVFVAHGIANAFNGSDHIPE